MFEPLDGPSAQAKINVTSTVVVEAKAGSSRFTDRKVVTLQTDKDIYVYFGDGSTTPAAVTVSANGFVQYAKSKESYECGEKQTMFLLAVSTTAGVVVAERA